VQAAGWGPKVEVPRPDWTAEGFRHAIGRLEAAIPEAFEEVTR
jgi:hypothetical protein